MQYLVLIYESESRFANGYPEAEFAEYGAFGKKTPARSKGATRYSPPNRQNRACTRQQDAHHRWSLRGDQGAAWRLLPDRSAQHRQAASIASASRPPVTAASKSGPSWSSPSSLGDAGPAPASSDSTLQPGSKEAP